MGCEKFWIEDGRCLFDSFSIFPSASASLESNCNAISRMILLFFLLLLCTGVSWDGYFIVVTFIIVIIFYYVRKRIKEEFVVLSKENIDKTQMNDIRESWGPVETIFTAPPPLDNYSSDGKTPIMLLPAQNEGRNSCFPKKTVKEFPLSFTPSNISNPQFIPEDQAHSWWSPNQQPILYERSVGINQALVGTANPKTFIKPVIPTPIADWNVWSPNSFVIPRNINDQRRQELVQNGYLESQNMSYEKRDDTSHKRKDNMSYERRTLITDLPPANDNEIKEDWYAQSHDASSYINTSCGDYPQNIGNNLPVNLNAPMDFRDPRMREYNENMFSIPIQPGIYTTSQVNQTDASQSNLGISMTQQFLPTTITRLGQDELLFTENIPTNSLPVYKSHNNITEVMRNEIYDPRSYGYSSNDRAYIDEMTGQPRFYYDDINAHTQYNYITRNNLDWAPFGTAAGPYEESSYSNMDIRNNAGDSYMQNQLQFRTELQQRLMHKNSNREWQQRIAPIITNQGARVGGGAGKGSYAGPRG